MASASIVIFIFTPRMCIRTPEVVPEVKKIYFILRKNIIFNKSNGCVISGFRRGVNGICALLGFYAMYGGSFLPTFRDNLSVQSSSTA